MHFWYLIKKSIIMAIKPTVKKTTLKTSISPILIKKKETILLKDIAFLEKNMANYKVERKSSWKAFKTKMEIDLDTIKQSIAALTQPIQEI